jgi:5-methylcytosine-specific restriction enzyme subunit McrC
LKRPDPIRVFEYDSICFKEGRRYYDSAFTEAHYEAFESFLLENEYCPFFELIPQGVRFKSYVGVIHIGHLTVEVLPKADKAADKDKEVWHGVLLDMLKACSLLTAKDVGNAPLRLRSNSILDLYFELFLSELDYLFHRGLMKQYRTKEGQQKALRGALVFSEHIRKNVVHKERFYTRHTTYDRDHLIHQVLFEALDLVERLADRSLFADLIGRLKMDFPQVSRIKVNAKTFDRIKDNRKTEPYRKAMEIAKLLLLNFRPDIRSGKNDMIALMFDMNKLWEEYILRQMQRDLSKEGWKVSGQKREKFWEGKTIRPDIVLTRDDVTYIIDTKWKMPDKAKPSDDDLKQMYVYNHHWNSTKSLLLYPKSETQNDVEGEFQLKMGEERHFCKMGYVEVVKDGKLNKGVGKEVLEKLLEAT